MLQPKQARPRAAIIPDEHILVCLSLRALQCEDHPHGRAHGQGLSRQVYRPVRGDAGLQTVCPEEDKQRLRANVKLAEQLGARIETVYGDDVALSDRGICPAERVSQGGRWPQQHPAAALRWGSSLCRTRLTVLAPNLDIYIIPDETRRAAIPAEGQRRRTKPVFTLAGRAEEPRCILAGGHAAGLGSSSGSASARPTSSPSISWVC